MGCQLAQSLGCCELRILPLVKSDTVHIHILLAAQNMRGMMSTRQLARPMQGDKAAKQRRNSVHPLLAATVNAISVEGAPFSVSVPPHQCQDSPLKLCQGSWQNTSHRWPQLQWCCGQAEAARQGGAPDPPGPLAVSTAHQTNRQTEISKKVTAVEPTHSSERVLKGYRRHICHLQKAKKKKKEKDKSNQN